MTALSPGEQVIKIVRDELVETLGQDTARVKFASQPPTVILMAGLQGSGKTTTSGKLATGSRSAAIVRCWFRWTCTVPRRASN
jgi:signal recognition particle GTPase